MARPHATIERLLADLRRLGVELDGDVAAATSSLENGLVHNEANLPMVQWLTSKTVARLRSAPSTGPAFAPVLWREPAWVRPFMVSYRVPWVIRARAGHPLPQGYQ